MSDDNDEDLPDDARNKQIIDFFEAQQKSSQPDVAKESIAFLDNNIRMLQPPDLFGTQRDSTEWFNIHSPRSKDTLAAIHVWIDEHKEHQLAGEISHKVG